MNNLPVEVLQLILIRLDIPPSELLDKITLVCKTWRSAIMTDWFLSRFYARRLACSPTMSVPWKPRNGILPLDPQPHGIPVSLGHGLFLNERNRYTQPISPLWPTSALAPCISLSMWLWLSSDCVRVCIRAHVFDRWFISLNIETDMFELQADNVLFSSPDASGTLPCETWVHVVFLCEQQQDGMTHCSAWIDGKQHEGTIHSTRPHRSKWVDIGHFGVYATEWSGPPYNCRLADLRLFPFLLTLPEIQAVTKQKTAIDKINMSTHWKTKTQDNQSADTTDLSRVNVGQLL